MRLSLSQAATLLGKSERQLRYLVKTGQIPATKADGKWSIDEADLPLTASQRSAIDARAEAARRAFEGALPPSDKPDPPGQPDAGRERVYTVTKLEAFRQGQALYRDARALLADDPACGLLFAALDHLTRGCHLFHADDKARAFALAAPGERRPHPPPPRRRPPRPPPAPRRAPRSRGPPPDRRSRRRLRAPRPSSPP